MSENILIVEDEDEWRGIYRRAVGSRGSGQQVKIAKDLAGAKQLIDAAKFAVAFVDVGLDVSDDRNVDGLRVMEWIRATGDDTSIIVVTGRSGQDVLPIIRDAIKKYEAYDTVGKSTVEPSEIRKLLDGGLQAHRKATAAGRMGAREAFRGEMDGLLWDHEVMRATQFKRDAGKFYDFLNQLFGEYLPIVSRHSGEHMLADSSTGLAYGDYWSRAIADAVVMCFGPAEQFDQAIRDNCVDDRLFGKYKIGDPIRDLSAYGAEGAVFSLQGCKREDFRGK